MVDHGSSLVSQQPVATELQLPVAYFWEWWKRLVATSCNLSWPWHLINPVPLRPIMTTCLPPIPLYVPMFPDCLYSSCIATNQWAPCPFCLSIQLPNMFIFYDLWLFSVPVPSYLLIQYASGNQSPISLGLLIALRNCACHCSSASLIPRALPFTFYSSI